MKHIYIAGKLIYYPACNNVNSRSTLKTSLKTNPDKAWRKKIALKIVLTKMIFGDVI